MKYSSRLFILFTIISAFSGCFVAQYPYTALPPGMWRAELKLDPMALVPSGESVPEGTRVNFEDVTQGELPFNFEVKYESDTKFYIEIRNGDERIRVDSIIIGRDKRTAKDTIRIEFPSKIGYIHGIFQDNIIQGEWVAYYNETERIPFAAKNGEDYRFTTLRKAPAMDVSGTWELKLENQAAQFKKIIINLKQDNNYLTGTINRDSLSKPAQLEGTVQANKLYLSGFDGNRTMMLIEAKIQSDGSMIGTFRNGNEKPMLWDAQRVKQ